MTIQKRITRSRDKMIAGVCSGIGNYLDVDPTIIRIAFVLLAFAGGAAILAYVIMWVIIPEDKIF